MSCRLISQISVISLTDEECGLTSAFRSDRIRTIHLLTVIMKVKLMTPLIFSRASSHKLLRL